MFWRVDYISSSSDLRYFSLLLISYRPSPILHLPTFSLSSFLYFLILKSFLHVLLTACTFILIDIYLCLYPAGFFAINSLLLMHQDDFFTSNSEKMMILAGSSLTINKQGFKIFKLMTFKKSLIFFDNQRKSSSHCWCSL